VFVREGWVGVGRGGSGREGWTGTYGLFRDDLSGVVAVG
jgi:hypothetical protein